MPTTRAKVTAKSLPGVSQCLFGPVQSSSGGERANEVSFSLLVHSMKGDTPVFRAGQSSHDERPIDNHWHAQSVVGRRIVPLLQPR